MNSKTKENDLIKFLNEIMPEGEKFKEEQLDQILEFTSQIIKEIPSKDQNQKNLRIAKEFIKIAKQDIKDAHLLYHNESFASSIYHLQQAVEKTTKAYGVAFFTLSEKDLQKIKHKTPKAFVMLLKKRYITPYIKLMKSFYPDLIEGNAQELEKLINSKSLEIAKFDKNQIEKILELGSQFKEISNNKEINDKIKSEISSLLDLRPSEFQNLFSENVKEKLIKLNISHVLGFVNLYFLSLITYPHEAYTRYPDGPMTPQDYTMETGIVVMSQEICESLQDSIKRFEEHLEEVEA